MDSALKGKVAVVTGGTGALGRALVRALLNCQARVHVPWRAADEARSLEEELGRPGAGLRLAQADLVDERAVRRFFDGVLAEDGGVDALFNVAGGFHYAELEATEARDWNRMLGMNATSAFLCSRAAASSMRSRGGGAIVNVAAVPALTRGGANMSAYVAAKSAVVGLTHALAAELGEAQITVNAIAPTLIDTPANRRAMPETPDSAFLDPDDVARVMLFLAGPEGAIVRGSVLTLAPV